MSDWNDYLDGLINDLMQDALDWENDTPNAETCIGWAAKLETFKEEDQ